MFLNPEAKLSATTGHKPPLAHPPPTPPPPPQRDVYYPADSPPPSPLPLPHYLRNNTLPHRRRLITAEEPTSHGNYLDEIGGNTYVNIDNIGCSIGYGCNSYTQLTSGTQKIELYQVSKDK